MQDLVEKFSKHDELAADPFSCTLATTKACLELLQHRRFVGREVDAEGLTASMSMLVETYARQALNAKSDILGTDEVTNVQKILVRTLDSLKTKDLLMPCKRRVVRCLEQVFHRT